MCALFGGKRDAIFITRISRELMGNIISQQCSFYKIKLSETKSNIYGEASSEKFYDGPFMYFCLIDKNPQQQTHMEEGITFNRSLEIAFLYQDLVDSEVVPEIGDVVLFEEGYYEIAGIVQNQFFAGKDPDYPNNDNPLNPGLEKFGQKVSLVVRANYVPADKVSISPNKERM